MPKISHDNAEESMGSPLSKAVEQVLPTAMISTVPVFIAGVSRKLNTGNFENVDMLAAISIPMPDASASDLEALAEIVNETAATAFALVSKEVGQRYEMLKDLQKSKHGRPEAPA